jgi:hypothetical protein
MGDTFDLGLTPKSERYDADDPRWLEQVADLVKELRIETNALRVRHTPVHGTKGTIDELILTLGSAGAFTTMLDLVRAWLARDKTRSVELIFQDEGGDDRYFTVTAANASAQALDPVMVALASRIATEP